VTEPQTGRVFRAKNWQIAIVYAFLLVGVVMMGITHWQILIERYRIHKLWEIYAMEDFLLIPIAIYFVWSLYVRLGSRVVLTSESIQKVSRTGRVLGFGQWSDVSLLQVRWTPWKSVSSVFLAFGGHLPLRIDGEYEDMKGLMSAVEAATGKTFQRISWLK
jgi:hypothetical protein